MTTRLRRSSWLAIAAPAAIALVWAQTGSGTPAASPSPAPAVDCGCTIDADPLFFQCADGGCKDMATWLVWSQRSGHGGTGPISMIHADAIAYCENLEESFFFDWELPTKDEMVALALNGPVPFQDSGGPNTHFWTSTTKGKKWAWAVSIDSSDGDPILVNIQFPSKAPVFGVRYSGPAYLDGRAVSGPAVELDWIDNSLTEDGFFVERSLDGNSWTSVATLPSSADAGFLVSYTDGGLASRTTYYYRVSAFVGAAASPDSVSPVSDSVSVRTKRN